MCVVLWWVHAALVGDACCCFYRKWNLFPIHFPIGSCRAEKSSLFIAGVSGHTRRALCQARGFVRSVLDSLECQSFCLDLVFKQWLHLTVLIALVFFYSNIDFSFSLISLTKVHAGSSEEARVGRAGPERLWRLLGPEATGGLQTLRGTLVTSSGSIHFAGEGAPGGSLGSCSGENRGQLPSTELATAGGVARAVVLGCEEGEGHGDSQVSILSRGCWSVWGRGAEQQHRLPIWAPGDPA